MKIVEADFDAVVFLWTMRLSYIDMLLPSLSPFDPSPLVLIHL